MIRPMLCQTGTVKDLSRQGYAGETKLDGTRCLIIKEKDTVTLQNRHGIIYTQRLPELVEASQQISGDFIIDGEIVYRNPETGQIEFVPCQRRCSTQDWAKIYLLKKKFPVDFYAFDILKLNGEDLTILRYFERKDVLENLIPSNIRIKYVPYRFDLERFWEEIKAQGEEGIILKNIHSRYVHERSWSWLKIKNFRTESYF